nr:aminotransferase class I/II-fold pyridoxal phosphate-dependent enzyme [Geminicoccus roseus]
MRATDLPPWRPTLQGRTGPKARGILEALVEGIRSGQLRPGDRLPPQRDIAAQLGVDLTTVTRALREAGGLGLIEASAGRGSFVAAGARASLAPDPADAGALVDLSMNIPPQPAAARLAERIPADLAAMLATPAGMAHLHYQETAGAEQDRLAAARWLGRRHDDVPPECVLVAAGAQSVLHALARLLLAPGDILCAGTFTYPGLKAVASQLGIVLWPLPMDAEGILPDAFAACCRAQRPKALYLVPAADNPTTATMGAERRQAVARVAADHGVPIIEDDAYAELAGDGLPSLASLAPDLVWHVDTLSKCATPALRTAFVLAPSRAGARRLTAMLRATSLMAPPLMTALASRWIGDGTLAAIVEAIRAENAIRQRLAVQALSGARFAAVPTCHHLWLELDSGWSAEAFAGHAARAGLAVMPGSAFAVGHVELEAVRVSLGAPSSRPALAEALHRLGQLLDEPPSGMHRPVI